MLLALVPPLALVRRELVDTLRKRRSFMFAALVVFFGAACLMSAWPSDVAIVTGRTNAFSETLLSVLFIMLLSGAALFIPGLAGSSIVSERDGDTLDQLQLTLLRPSMIVLSKLASMLAFYTLLIVSALPFLAATLFLLGISAYQIAMGILALYLTTACCASAGLLCSAFFRRTVVAIVMSYVGMLIAFGGFIPVCVGVAALFKDTIVGDCLSNLFEFLARFMRSSGLYGGNPRDLIVFTLTPVWPAGIGVGWAPSVLFPIAYQISFSASCLMFTRRVLSRPAKAKRVDRRKLIDDPALLEARRKRFPYYLIDPLKRREPIEDGINAMFVREFRWGLLGRLTFLVRGFYVSFIVAMLFALTYLLTLVAHSPYQPTVAQTITMTSVACLLGTALLANTMTKERDLGNLDMLRMTLLRPREIIMGKFTAGLATVAPFLPAMFLTVMLLSIGCAAFSGNLDVLLAGLQGMITFLVCTVLCLAITLWASTAAKKTVGAVLRGFGMNLLFLIGLYLFAMLAWRYIERYDVNRAWSWVIGAQASLPMWRPWQGFEEHIRLALGALSPFGAYIPLLDRCTPIWWISFPAWFINMCALLLLCRVFLWLSIRRLSRYGMRDDATRRSRPIQ